MHMNHSREIIGVRVDADDYEQATRRIMSLARSGVAAYVCAANVHMLMEARDDQSFHTVVSDAHLVTADGMPLVWMLRRLGVHGASRVYGPTLMLHLCKAAAQEGVHIGLLGGTAENLAPLIERLQREAPGVQVAYACSPPFRELSSDEDEAVVAAIRASGARLLFVGLGCPKQERWMAAHKSRLPLVQIGVGAAFDFHAGRVKQAPGWIQDRGLEWFFRLLMEPRRLWRRYLRHNPRFIALATLQLFTREPR